MEVKFITGVLKIKLPMNLQPARVYNIIMVVLTLLTYIESAFINRMICSA